MPRFFFHYEGARNFHDAVGADLPDNRAAEAEAIRRGHELMKDGASRFDDHPMWRILVIDEDGSPIFLLGITVARLSR